MKEQKEKKQTSKKRDFHVTPEVCKVHGTYLDSCPCTPIHPNFYKISGLVYDVDECLKLNVD